MKIRNLFLLGLSAAALASCGGVKEPNAYKNEVKKADFLTKFQEAVKDNVLFHAFDEGKEPFSCVVESESSSENYTTNLKGDTEYDKELVKSSSKGSMKLDMPNKVGSSVGESSSETTGDGVKGNSQTKSDGVIKLDGGFIYSINNVTKSFTKAEAPKENTEKEFFRQAYYSIYSQIQSVFAQAINANEEKTKFYIDDSVYTFVVENKYSDEGIYAYSETTTNFYQIALNGDSFEYFSKYDYEYKTETYKRASHSLTHNTISKKDVSVKAPNIDKYLDVTPVLK